MKPFYCIISLIPLRNVISVCLLLLLQTMAFGQQEVTLPFMPNISQSSAIFPTNRPKYDVVIGLPGVSGVYLGMQNSAFSIGDIYENKTIFPSRLPGLTSGGNYLSLRNEVDLLHVRFRTRKLFWSVGGAVETQANMVLPHDFFRLFVEGNAPFVNTNTRADLSDLRFESYSYASAYIGLNAPIDADGKWIVGGRIRRLGGIAYGGITNNQLGITPTDPDNYGQAVNADYLMRFSSPVSLDSFSSNATPKFGLNNGGWGADLGLTYQYSDRWKFSFAATNFGYINWKDNATSLSGRFNTINFNGFTLDQLRDTADKFNGEAIGDTLKNRFKADTTRGGFTTYLSPRLLLAASYELPSKTVLSLAAGGSFYNGFRPAATLNVYQPLGRLVDITAGVVYQNSRINNISAGLMLKPGPFQIYFVTDNMLGWISPVNTRMLNARVGLNLVFGKGRERDNDKDGIPNRHDECPDDAGLKRFKGCPDRDNDGIPDKADQCPTEAGLAALQGCPDRDNDGIRDSEDRCPDQAGAAMLQGCPDKDGDGIADLDDQCPDEPGSREMLGCPDKDKDGITDKEDACPEIAGPKETKGCPDKDGDGVLDKDDLCPDKPGKVETKGCPDTDGDGLFDNVDACPDKKGPASNKGCPLADRDGDGVLDADDACPDVAGLAINKGCPDVDSDNDGVVDRLDECPKTPGTLANNGCPELKAEEQQVLKTAFADLEFETAKDIIKRKSYPALQELAKLLVLHPEYKLRVAGHTDNVGKPAINMQLSKARSMAVKRFLVKEGVKPEQVKAEWYGATKPIASNKTPEGRTKNRRVEMKVLFD